MATVQTTFAVEQGVGSAAAEETDDVAGDAREGHACLVNHANHYAARALIACPSVEEVLVWAMRTVAKVIAALVDLTQIQALGVRAEVDMAIAVRPEENSYIHHEASVALAGGQELGQGSLEECQIVVTEVPSQITVGA